MLQFTLPFPPSVNSLYPSNRFGKGRHKSKKAKEWEKEAHMMLCAQKVKPIESRCRICYDLDSPTLHRRDVGNYEKALTDLLVSAKILKEDDIRYVKGINSEWTDKKGNSVKVTLVPV